MQKQRASLQHKAKALKKALGKMKEDPAAKTEESRRSPKRSAPWNGSRDIGELPLFNLLTDEGLIPNYAFPESGVVLRSSFTGNWMTEEWRAIFSSMSGRPETPCGNWRGKAPFYAGAAR
jgi:hypothetical protein